ncbi:MAG: hypothetical protein R6X08_09660 [Desulfosalsimonadaceae bacterium]
MYTVEIFLHFHPGITTEIVSNGCVELLDRETGRSLAMINWQGDGNLHVDEGFWCPEFGRAEASHRCVFRFEDVELPVKTGFEMAWKQYNYG